MGKLAKYPGPSRPARSKYGNKRVVMAGEKFDSQREANRWLILRSAQTRGEIRDLERQVTYVLAPPVKLHGEGRQKPALRYVADFRYVDENGKTVVEDAKGHETKEFRVKRHLMKSVHGIDVVLS